MDVATAVLTRRSQHHLTTTEQIPYSIHGHSAKCLNGMWVTPVNVRKSAARMPESRARS